jgi:peptidoglycan/xylan/chitin deacetylase (PgdA/CDA1 family)
MLTEARGLTPDALALAQRSGIRVNEMPPYARGASLADINAALTYDGLSLGAHTWNHPNLTTLSDSELADEFTRPLGWLRQFGDRALPMVSYPYGLANLRVMDAARAAGYAAAFMIDGGWTSPDTVDKFAIPRLNVPAGVSRNGFVLRAAGLLSD